MRIVLGAVLAVAFTLGGPGAGAGSQVVVVQGVDATTLDPNMDTLIQNRNIVMNIFDTLVERDREMQLRPGLATGWEALDPVTWRFALRKGVRFHNGEAFTAESVKYTIERILDPNLKSKMLHFASPIKEVQVLDPHTVLLRTKEPYPLLLSRLSGIPIVPRETVERVGPARFASRPVGTGPYRFVSWAKDDQVVLEASDQHWRGAPRIKRVVFKPIPEASTRVAALQTGAADLIVNLPINMVSVLREGRTVRVASVPSVRVMHVALEAGRKPLDDVRVRRALNYAVDAEALVKNLLGGYGRRVNSLIDPTSFGYNPALKPYPYDPARARQLLAEAGQPGGLEIEFSAPAGRFLMDKEMAEAIAGQLEKVGVRAKLRILEYGVLIKEIWSKKTSPMYLFSWGSPTFDADGTLYPKLRTGQQYAHYSNPKVDELLDLAHGTLDVQKRLQAYHELARIIHEEAPVIFLYQLEDLYGISRRLAWEPRADEMLWMFEASVQP